MLRFASHLNRHSEHCHEDDGDDDDEDDDDGDNDNDDQAVTLYPRYALHRTSVLTFLLNIPLMVTWMMMMMTMTIRRSLSIHVTIRTVITIVVNLSLSHFLLDKSHSQSMLHFASNLRHDDSHQFKSQSLSF